MNNEGEQVCDEIESRGGGVARNYVAWLNNR